MNKFSTIKHKLPSELEKILMDYECTINTIGCSKTEVYKLVKEDQTLYLKINKPESIFNLAKEKTILKWIGSKLPAPDVIFYSMFEGKEYLLITEIEGKVSFEAKSDEEKRSAIRILAEGLRKIHSIDASDSPINNLPDNLIKLAKDRMEKKLVKSNNFDERWANMSVEELFEEVLRLKPDKYDLVFTHGDYCLPNIIVNDGKLSGFIDWLFAGTNDRYFDLAAVVWSIGFNFGAKWTKYFFEDYGLEDIDWDRIKFYQMLNEFFQQ